MLVINARNVNEALPLALMHLRERGVPRPSRVGNVIEYPEPVTTVYHYPDECVLFDAERDANPFFHFFEALWILGGGEDVATLAKFLPRIAEYSDNGEIFHGAYGHRIRHAFGFDQLNTIVEMLRVDPNTRRAVISIYDPVADTDMDSKDIPCNDMIMFKIRDGALHMTVCNRSNDAIWGAYGANAVQFSFLMQYVAIRVGVRLGCYTQVSDSLHVYESNPYWQSRKYGGGGVMIDDPYAQGKVLALLWPSMVVRPEDLDSDLKTLQEGHALGSTNLWFFNHAFFQIAMDMLDAHKAYRADDLRLARYHANKIPVEDWRMACLAWIQRRIDKRQERGIAA